MKFLVITSAPTLKEGDKILAYAPYVNEMNLWFSNINEVKIVSPTKYNNKLLKKNFDRQDIKISSIPELSLVSFKEIIKTLFKLPIVIYKIFIEMLWADHIHIRVPGNIGLLGVLIQMAFPKKIKTAKYAGNWDPKSAQPFSYRIQKWLLSNTFLTRNIKVLVYGNWSNQTKNIMPFFTATYYENEIKKIPKKDLKGKIKFVFVGNFSVGKQPLKSVQVVERLYRKGFHVELNMYGDGEEYKKVEKYVEDKNLNKIIILKGNSSKACIKKAFQESHFLVFISKSEGWPKVVAESMFWSCLPISTNVSCIPFMLGNGERGAIIEDNIDTIVETIEIYLRNEEKYQKTVKNAKLWSQQYTLDRFKNEIKKLV